MYSGFTRGSGKRGDRPGRHPPEGDRRPKIIFFCGWIYNKRRGKMGVVRRRQLKKPSLSEGMTKQVAQLSQRDRAAGWVSQQLLSKVEDWDWETIFYGHYRSIFNHCDVFGQQSNRIGWKTQNKGSYAVKVVQDHSRSSRSVPIESPYATSY